MRQAFFILSFILIAATYALLHIWPNISWIWFVVGTICLIGYRDAFQRKHTILRNFPFIGHFRYLFEFVRPEIQQYFVESDLSGRPVSRVNRSVIYQRAKKEIQTVPFGTQEDVYQDYHEWTNHSLRPITIHSDQNSFRVLIGGPQCKRPYSASLFNVSAMSYGALSKNAIMALNLGAKKGGFYHNTGEGGLSPYHEMGGDVVWQIGTGYFGCRTQEGRFSEELFQKKSQLEVVKMVEIKLSQGAKPGHGGILPGAKVTPEIASIRNVTIGQTVHSPPSHSAFSTPIELLEFIQKLRELSGGKPIGIKLCVGYRSEFFALCKAMVQTKIKPDFITVDGSEGGTGAAPIEFANSVGTPLNEGLSFVADTLQGMALKEDIRIIASGKIFTGFHIVTKLSLGADLVNSARGMMFALGCIQALRCNSNKCPAGIATTDRRLSDGLDVPSKSDRVANYHHETITAFGELLGAMGHTSALEIERRAIYRRMGDNSVKTYETLYPTLERGVLFEREKFLRLPYEYRKNYYMATAQSFKPLIESEWSRQPENFLF